MPYQEPSCLWAAVGFLQPRASEGGWGWHGRPGSSRDVFLQKALDGRGVIPSVEEGKPAAQGARQVRSDAAAACLHLVVTPRTWGV